MSRQGRVKVILNFSITPQLSVPGRRRKLKHAFTPPENFRVVLIVQPVRLQIFATSDRNPFSVRPRNRRKERGGFANAQ